MTPADFLAHTDRIYFKTSQGKDIFLPPPQYPLDLPDRFLVVSHPLDVSMLCYLIRPARPLYPVPVRLKRGLQSRFLQCVPHGKPPCDLVTLRDVTPRT